MIQDIITNLVKSQIGSIFSNENIPPEHQDGIVEAASDAISNGVKQQANSNPQGFTEIVRLLGNRIGLEKSSLVSTISQMFIDAITKRFGIAQGTASSMASTLIPNVLGSLVKMINDPKETGVTLNGVIGALTDGKTTGHDLQGILDQNHDGHLDSHDLMSWGKHLFSKLFAGK